MSIKMEEGKYWGRQKYQVNLNNKIITHSHYNAFSHLPQHYHENFVLGYITSGSYQEKILRHVHFCDKGSLIIQPPGVDHENIFKVPSATCFNIEFTRDKVEELKIAGIQFRDWKMLKNAVVNNHIDRIIKELQSPDALTEIIVESMVNEIIVYGYRNCAAENKGIPYKIKKVKDFLDETYFQGHLLNDLAQQVGITPFHLSREFKKHYQYTIGGYIRHKRITESISKLKAGKKDINEIAYECGFSDASHYVRVFKKIIGTTPNGFRRNN